MSKSELEGKYEWLHPPCKILCDFGQCEKASMVTCKDCDATLCLDHMKGHGQSCGIRLEGESRMRFEQEIIDGKDWREVD